MNNQVVIGRIKIVLRDFHNEFGDEVYIPSEDDLRGFAVDILNKMKEIEIKCE